MEIDFIMIYLTSFLRILLNNVKKVIVVTAAARISLTGSARKTANTLFEKKFGTTIMGVPSGSKTFTFWGNNYISVSIGNNSSIPVIAFYECLQLQKGEEYIVLPPYRHTMGTPFYVDVPEHELPFLWVFKFDASYYEREGNINVGFVATWAPY